MKEKELRYTEEGTYLVRVTYISPIGDFHVGVQIIQIIRHDSYYIVYHNVPFVREDGMVIEDENRNFFGEPPSLSYKYAHTMAFDAKSIDYSTLYYRLIEKL